VPQSIASNWLVPRLHRYHEFRPNMEIRVTVLATPIDFSQHIMDIGVAFGWEVPAGLERHPWLSYDIVAACSPRLLEGPDGLREPCDLARFRLLHDDALRFHDRLDWRQWFERFGLDGANAAQGIRFSQTTHAYQMALDGHGVVLAKTALIADALRDGRLVKLFDQSIPSDLRYDLVYSEALADHPKLVHFRDWLIDEARHDGSLSPIEEPSRPAKRRMRQAKVQPGIDQ